MSDASASLHQKAPISFTGTGSEYFRIWIVNLVLTYLTLGIYSAWAKVRREKFFHQHTQIAGHSLDYHGEPIAILKGRAIAFGLFMLYSLASAIPIFWLVALCGMVAVVPFLMQRSIRFRLANSSYRGIRFAFQGTVRQAYTVLAPFVVIAIVVLAALMLGAFGLMAEDGTAPTPAPETAPAGMPSALAIIGALMSGLGLVALFASLHAVWRRYCIDHAYYGSVKTSTSIVSKRFIWIYLSSLGLVVLLLGLPVVAAALSAIVPKSLSLLVLIVPLVMFLSYLLLLTVQGILAARLQNYCWHKATDLRTQSGHQLAWFESALSLKKYGLLQLKNWILTIFTLGLYRPFAVVNSAKARLEALTLSNSRFIDFIVGAQAEKSSAIGQEALEAFDIDFSL